MVVQFLKPPPEVLLDRPLPLEGRIQLQTVKEQNVFTERLQDQISSARKISTSQGALNKLFYHQQVRWSWSRIEASSMASTGHTGEV